MPKSDYDYKGSVHYFQKRKKPSIFAQIGDFLAACAGGVLVLVIIYALVQ